jgi:DNA polymerase (family X)
MPIALNEDIAGRLDEVSRILAEQEANRFRVQAYEQAATVLRGLSCSVSEVFAKEGIAGLEKIPGVGETIARSIRDILLHGKLAMLQRLRGEHDPLALLRSVPGVGKVTAWKLYEDLGIESLEELEAAAHDGRLGRSQEWAPSASPESAILSRNDSAAFIRNRPSPFSARTRPLPNCSMLTANTVRRPPPGR